MIKGMPVGSSLPGFVGGHSNSYYNGGQYGCGIPAIPKLAPRKSSSVWDALKLK